MQHTPSILEARAERYLHELLVGETPVMERLRRESLAEGLPCVHPATGRVLQVLAASTRATRALEIGTNIGYSALWLFNGMSPDGRVDTLEIDPEFAQRARDNLEDAGVGDRARVLEGDAVSLLPTLTPPYDFVFIDADKANYLVYLREALRLTRRNGVIAADNILWSGRVYDERAQDDETNAIRQYTKAILANSNLVSTLLPVGDGVAVSVVRP